MSELKNQLLLLVLLAVALGGCSTLPDVSLSDFNMLNRNDLLHTDDYNSFYRRDASTSGAVSAADLVGPDGRCAFSPAPAPTYASSPAAPAAAPEPVGQAPVPAPASDPINPRSNQALYFTAGPEANAGAGARPSALPAQVRNGPSGIALQMTECQVVAVAGYTERVEIGADHGQRSVTLTYLSGERPGIYRFVNGRLASMERVAEPAATEEASQETREDRQGEEGRPGAMTDPDSPDFAARRLAARARIDAIDDAGASDPYRRAWFEAVYETAGDDPAQIPWADLSPHPLLAAWLADTAPPKPAHARSMSGAGSATTRRRLPPRAGA